MDKQKDVEYDDSIEPHEREAVQRVKSVKKAKRAAKKVKEASADIPDSVLTPLEIFDRDEAGRVLRASQTKFQVSSMDTGRRHYVLLGTLKEFLEWVSEQECPVIVDKDCDEVDGTWHLQLYDED